MTGMRFLDGQATGARPLRRAGRLAIAVLAGAALMACDSLWPESEPRAPAQAPQQVAADTVEIAPSAAEIGDQGVRVSVPANDAAVGQTFVGRKVAEMQNDLSKLNQGVRSLQQRKVQLNDESRRSADRYHALVAAITSRLQQGTTPGNPVLVAQWNQAQSALERIAEGMPEMTKLSNDAADEAAFGQYLLNAVQATYGLSGAVEEDHIRLRQLEDSVHQGVVSVDRLLNELSQDINRQTTYVNNERQNMTTLSLAIKNGELYGSSLATRAFTQTENLARAAARAQTPGPGDRPLVIIRFDRPNVEYQQALYNAVSQALSRKPTATFDLVAVSPSFGNAAQIALNTAAAKRNAEDVLRTLTDMGVPSSRIQLLATSDSAVETNEVHLFVR